MNQATEREAVDKTHETAEFSESDPTHATEEALLHVRSEPRKT